MDSSSIYEDLQQNTDLGTTIHQLQIENEQLKVHVSSLEIDIQKLCDKILNMKQVQDNLSRNISELFKTAKNEISRKDNMIAELQAKLDDMVFRRNSAVTSFSTKRFREDLPHSREVPKKSKNDDIVQDDKKPVVKNNDEFNKNEAFNESQDRSSRIHNKYRERGNEYNSSRYDSDHRRRSNYDRNYRKDPKDYRGRNSCNDDRKRRDSRCDKYSEARNRNGKHGRERDVEHSTVKRHSSEEIDLTNEPRFSPHESPKSTPEPPEEILSKKLNDSREEGEITDSEIVSEEKQKNKKNSEPFNGNENNIKLEPASKTSKKDKINPSTIKKEFNVLEFIEKQQNFTNVKNQKDNSEKLNVKKTTKPSKREHKEESNRKDNNENEKRAEKKTKGSISKTEINKEKSSQHLKKEEKSIAIENYEGRSKAVKNDKITILSEIVLKTVENESTITNVKLKPNTESEDGTEQTKNTLNVNTVSLSKVDKGVRECRVPRNLTGELDIKVEKPVCDVKKESQVPSKKMEQKLASLFDTPCKESTHKDTKIENLDKNCGLTHEGAIPDLDFGNQNDAKEATSNQSIVDVQGSLTPVTEFQIFKTNLPSLEKSNSLSSVQVQFQTNTAIVEQQVNDSKETTNLKKNVEIDDETETTKLKSTQMSSDCKNHKGNLDLKGLSPSTQTVVNNESLGYGNSGDMCNISLDLLNAHLGEYKMEDYPNLVAHRETKDISDLLSSPLKISTEKPLLKEQCNSSIIESNKNEDEEKMENSESKKDIPVVTPQRDANNVKHEETTLTNNTISPNQNSANSKRKRKRCVLRWAE